MYVNFLFRIGHNTDLGLLSIKISNLLVETFRVFTNIAKLDI